MTKVLLCKKYYCFHGDIHNTVDRVEAEFKTQGLVITQEKAFHNAITINKKGQQILYEELKKRFEK